MKPNSNDPIEKIPPHSLDAEISVLGAMLFDNTVILKVESMDFLHPDHLADLRKSGLSDDTILEAEIKSARPADIDKIIGFQTFAKSAYEILYPDLNYSRFKIFYDDANIINPRTMKPRPKYLQRKGSCNHLYIPKDVRPILHDSSKPLFIAEGEKKCLKAVQEGLNCIGLSGLWNWTDRKKFDITDKLNWRIGEKEEGKELIKDFDSINFNGRTVYIVPDSDWLKPNKHGYPTNLKLAVFELAEKLQERGARVFVVQLPRKRGV